MASDQDDDGWLKSAGRKAWLARRAARQERREVIAAIAAGPDEQLGIDAIAIAARDPTVTDANLRSLALLLGMVFRPSFSGLRIPLDRELAARRLIGLCPKDDRLFTFDTPSPAAGVDVSAVARRGIAVYQDHLGLNAEHARADALADGVASGKVTPIDAAKTAAFILASHRRATGEKEPKK
jgi:hypothetical protein